MPHIRFVYCLVLAHVTCSACNSGGSLPDRAAADGGIPVRVPSGGTTTGGQGGGGRTATPLAGHGSLNNPRFDAGTKQAVDDDDASVGPDGFCEAPLPTGFCWRSDSGDYIGGGRARSAAGAETVRVSQTSGVSATMTDDDGQSMLTADFSAGQGKDIELGRYTNATRSPFNNNNPGLDVGGDGRGCNQLTGEFTIRELEFDPASSTISRLSVVFEQHCEGGAAALRGMINFQANGKPDEPIVASRTIALSGKVSRLRYEPSSHIAYGLDFANRKVVRIDLGSGMLQVNSVVQVPNDLCVDSNRKRLFVVNKKSSIISVLDLETLMLKREITWTPMDSGPDETHFHIECARDKLYVVDGAWQPGLFTVENLDTDAPTVTDRTPLVSSVGALTLNAAQDTLYYWTQIGWSAGDLNTAVRRVNAADFSVSDTSTVTTSQGFVRDPVDAPILLDETRKLLFAKNMIFDALNLGKVIYTLPGKVNVGSLQGAPENTYALSIEKGLIASHKFVYKLDRYDIVAPTYTKHADQMFFDRDGLLWFLTTSAGKLEAQNIEP